MANGNNTTGKAVLQWAATVLASVAVATASWSVRTTTKNAQDIAVNYREMEVRFVAFDKALSDIQERDIASIRDKDIVELRRQMQELRDELVRIQERAYRQAEGKQGGE